MGEGMCVSPQDAPGGLTPNVISFSAAISLCGAGGQWERARCSTRCAWWVSHPTSSASVVLSQHGCVISGGYRLSLLGSQGAQCHQLLRGHLCIRERWATGESFFCCSKRCVRGGQWERARLLLDKMRKAGMAPNVISFSASLSAYGKGGQWERARCSTRCAWLV